MSRLKTLRSLFSLSGPVSADRNSIGYAPAEVKETVGRSAVPSPVVIQIEIPRTVYKHPDLFTVDQLLTSANASTEPRPVARS